MIKFFRRIRQNLLKENKTGKYFKYAFGEIFLVVIGILIAIAVNNWNSQRIKTNRNQDLLAKISKELDSNITRMTLLDSVSFNHRFIYSDSLFKLLDRNLEINDFDFMVSDDIYLPTIFNLNTSIFEELKNTGSLYAIGSDSLVAKIQRYYQNCERESSYNLESDKNVLQFKNKCYEGWFDFKYLYLKNPESALKNHEWIFNSRSVDYIRLRQYVEYANFHYQFVSKKAENIIKESEELKNFIVKEQNIF